MTNPHPWYPFYVADYGRDTAHLSLVEDGAYRRLLDHYYSTRRPLPTHVEQVFRICRAFAPSEQDAVRTVLKQFFIEEHDGYHNRRTDLELARSQEIIEKRSKAGRASAQKRAAEAATLEPTRVKHVLTQSQSQSQSKPESEPDSKTSARKRAPSRSQFVLPTLDEVIAYCQERKNQVDAEKWLNHYEANGWKVGRNPMKDWKAAVRTWEKNEILGHGGRGSRNDKMAPESFASKDYTAGLTRQADGSYSF